MTVRAVFWDMGGVLVRTHDPSGRERWRLRLGLPPGELERRVFEGATARKASVGRANEAQIWADLGRDLGLSDEEHRQLATDFFSGDRVDHDLADYIRSLRPGVKTGLISNAWPELRRYLEQEWRIADAFDTLVISAEVGLAKPDPAIFRLALDRLQVEPAESIFVDDFEVNVDAARQVGMCAVAFRSPEQARREVERHLTDSGGMGVG